MVHLPVPLALWLQNYRYQFARWLILSAIFSKKYCSIFRRALNGRFVEERIRLSIMEEGPARSSRLRTAHAVLRLTPSARACLAVVSYPAAIKVSRIAASLAACLALARRRPWSVWSAPLRLPIIMSVLGRNVDRTPAPQWVERHQQRDARYVMFPEKNLRLLIGSENNTAAPLRIRVIS